MMSVMPMMRKAGTPISIISPLAEKMPSSTWGMASYSTVPTTMIIALAFIAMAMILRTRSRYPAPML